MITDLRKAYMTVIDASQLGDGFPDLIIGQFGFTGLIETKTPRGLKTAREQLSDSQSNFGDIWTGSPIIYAHSAADALEDWQSYLRLMRGQYAP